MESDSGLRRKYMLEGVLAYIHQLTLELDEGKIKTLDGFRTRIYEDTQIITDMLKEYLLRDLIDLDEKRLVSY